MGERRHHQLLGSTTLLNPQKTLTSKKQIDNEKSRPLTAGNKKRKLRQNYCAYFLCSPLLFWLFVLCALFIVQTLKRAFPTSFSVAKSRRKLCEPRCLRYRWCVWLSWLGKDFRSFLLVLGRCNKEGRCFERCVLWGVCFECVQGFS
jgi:hypothetical protein